MPRYEPLSPSMGTIIRGDDGRAALDHDQLVRDVERCGAVLLRDFGFGVAEFENLTRKFTSQFLVHHSPGRAFVNADGTTQTVTPGNAYTAAHIERGYAPPIPDFLFFHCVRPAARNGETTLYDGYQVLECLGRRGQSVFLQ